MPHRTRDDHHCSWLEATTHGCDRTYSHPSPTDDCIGIGKKFHTPGGPYTEPEDWPCVSTILSLSLSLSFFLCFYVFFHFFFFLISFSSSYLTTTREHEGKRTHSLFSWARSPITCRVERKIEDIPNQPNDIEHAQHPQRSHKLVRRRPPGNPAY